MALSVSETGQGRLGTFSGVFTPSILTILGLILFLRLGYVVGMTGLGEALVIIVLANTISVVTSISLAAVATNLKVKGGGVYYIISRTLGLPFGGAIGLVLFVAQAISVGFYCVGFAEAVAAILGTGHGYASQAIAAAAVVVIMLIAWVGSDWATRVQYIVMALLVAALLSFAAGVFEHWNPLYLSANFVAYNGWGNFWIAFAVFFPAVTGFTQGVNMSGDLADAGKSIPRGTAYAVGVSFVIYVAVAVACAATLPSAELISNYGAMKTISAFGPLIDAGIIAATLSSALASLLGAPRILQSLAKDRVFSFLRPFAQGAGPSNNPRRGILLTGGIALGIIALGNLNLIAALVSMFFVVTYGLLNYATYYEARGQSPAFRPTLRWYDPRISLIGAIGALGILIAINLAAGLAALAIVFGIYQYLKRSAIAARWADGQRSYNLQVVREHLLQANSRAEHPRDWRPQILAFSGDNIRRDRMLTFASWIEGHSGLTTVVRIIEGKGKRVRRRRDEAEEEMAESLKASGIQAFPLVIANDDADAAVRIAVQAVGVGPTRINTAMVNWPSEQTVADDTPENRRFARNVHSAFLLGCNVLVLDANEAEWIAVLDHDDAAPATIDIWWRDNSTGRLMLVLAYLLTRNDAWRGAEIRLVAEAPAEAAEARRSHLEKVLRDVRIPGTAHVVPPNDDKIELIAGFSTRADIVFVALAFRDEWFSDWHGNDLSKLLPRLPLTVLTMAAEDVDLSADPDEGEESDRAAAKDAYDDAVRKRARAATAVDDVMAALMEKSKESLTKEGDEGVEAALAKLKTDLAEAHRVLTMEDANLANARAEAEELGVKQEAAKET